jgi:predicted RNase H-like nuclease (RuvC/YqgF family)
MIDNTIQELKKITLELQSSIKQDIEDVKAARHEALLERNELKLDSMEKLSSLKQQLNNELSQEFSSGKDVSIYKEPIDELERELKHLYYLNGKLGSIVLPVKEMYKEIIDEITAANGGRLIEVMA